MTRLTRVRVMSGHEIAFRLGGHARAHAQRIRTRLLGTHWDRRDIRQAIHPSLLDSSLEGAIARADWASVNAQLRGAVRRRPSTHVLDPDHADLVRQTIATRFPDAARQATAHADAILANRYDLLGYRGLAFSGGSLPDWHADPVHGRRAPFRFWADVPYLDPACGDHKVIWELNRHQHFLQLGRALWLTGDARYGARIVAELESWLTANPPLWGINWASMLELALRALSWVAAIHFLIADDRHGRQPDRARLPDVPWLLDALVALDHQLRHVEQNLSLYFSPNTHLTGEALALYTAGVALPELAGSARWTRLGRSILLREASRQICEDGGHVERSTHYHRYTLDFYLLAWLTAICAGDHDGAAAFGPHVGRLARVMRALADGTGRLPQIGDDDGGMLWPVVGRDPRDVRASLTVAALLLDEPDLAPWAATEDALWMAGIRAVSWMDRPRVPAPPSGAAVTAHVFPQTGYVAVHTARGDHLVFDTGPHGYLNGGHAHADALSVMLALGGRPLLIDPGTATYTMDPSLRDRMRDSRSHNTLSIDGRSFGVVDGPFRWRRSVDARLSAWCASAGFVWAEAWHDGYAPFTHLRRIVGGSDGWLIVDEIRGDRPCRVECLWHFDPSWDLSTAGPSTVGATAAHAAQAWLLSDAPVASLTKGDAERGLGWCSPCYGVLVPTWTARMERPVTPVDSIVSWLGTGARAPRLDRIATEGRGHTVAVRVSDDHGTIVTILGDAAARERHDVSADGYRTDARLLQVRRAGGRVLRLSMADGMRVDSGDAGLPAVRADRPTGDLHVTIEGDRLQAWCSEPPPSLLLHAAEMEHVTSFALNARECPLERPRGGSVTLRQADWGPPGSGLQTGPRPGPAGGHMMRPRRTADAVAVEHTACAE